jgi:hypothetical protein
MSRENSYLYRELDTGIRDCVIIAESAINTVMPVKTGIQNLLKPLDSVSRFACTE